ncbi:hypothetical protein M404DRAFT_10705 [Pisolithus tinctorius Marx 270]|uniref:Geminivirus AL1 replication-associated protein central domain-containing protein n=1 Tax=Pisolithus tinctorius Marx 270 TaxID=870435 RepID=A0A0C3JJC0_PISTI|nr:hypothetical protein M404DRAFT_10705 [Pisolithus tinctorius Marx 270]
MEGGSGIPPGLVGNTGMSSSSSTRLKSHQDLLTWWEYIHKEERVEVFRPWQGPSGNAEVQDLKEGKHDEHFIYICSATSRDDFEDHAKELTPYDWIIHHDKFMSFVDKQWKVPKPAYKLQWMEFPCLPAVMAEWASGEMKNPDQLKTLCMWGPSWTGKTEWARSLVLHIYMNGQLNATKLFELDDDQEPKYMVLNDMDIDHFWSVKEFFSAQ